MGNNVFLFCGDFADCVAERRRLFQRCLFGIPVFNQAQNTSLFLQQ
jgi:hypothetical protein